MKAGLRPPTASKRRPASSSCSRPPGRSPRSMRRRARRSRKTSARSISEASRAPPRLITAAASSSRPCSIRDSPRNEASSPGKAADMPHVSQATKASRASASASCRSPRNRNVSARCALAAAKARIEPRPCASVTAASNPESASSSSAVARTIEARMYGPDEISPDSNAPFFNARRASVTASADGMLARASWNASSASSIFSATVPLLNCARTWSSRRRASS